MCRQIELLLGRLVSFQNVYQEAKHVYHLFPVLVEERERFQSYLKEISFIDAEDAAEGLVSLLLSSPKWEKVYNMGWDRCRYTLTEIADVVADVSEKFGYGRPEVILEKQDISLWSGIDSMRFMEHTGWKIS